MDSLRDQVLERGYAFMPAWRPEQSAANVAASFGEPLSLGGGDPVHALTPVSKEASTPNTYSGLYGLEDFPFHTDMAHWRAPPRYLMLRCVVGFKEVPTRLIDGLELARRVGLDRLARAIVRPRRPVQGKLSLLRIYQPVEEGAVLRWDEIFIQPASTAGEEGYTEFGMALRLSDEEPVALATPGDTLVVDNWRMLHGRAPVPAGCEGRRLDRVYLRRLH
ncbi:Fe(II)-2OG oxygenase family protein [Rhizobium laguerreae]|uniref:TauD/TfdA family dioxygenase n=1 Tax=Rhizobium laguerreae TaxID=1076926 RepID=UPI0021B0A9B0|nr:TauD/TfdA family dioxygenase [Rhizobium laguerreae]